MPEPILGVPGITFEVRLPQPRTILDQISFSARPVEIIVFADPMAS